MGGSNWIKWESWEIILISKIHFSYLAYNTPSTSWDKSWSVSFSLKTENTSGYLRFFFFLIKWNFGFAEGLVEFPRETWTLERTPFLRKLQRGVFPSFFIMFDSLPIEHGVCSEWKQRLREENEFPETGESSKKWLGRRRSKLSLRLFLAETETFPKRSPRRRRVLYSKSLLDPLRRITAGRFLERFPREKEHPSPRKTFRSGRHSEQ